MLRRFRAKATAIIEGNKFLLQKLAGELEVRGTLNQGEIAALMGRA